MMSSSPEDHAGRRPDSPHAPPEPDPAAAARYMGARLDARLDQADVAYALVDAGRALVQAHAALGRARAQAQAALVRAETAGIGQPDRLALLLLPIDRQADPGAHADARLFAGGRHA